VKAGYLGESQKPGVDRKLGLPRRDPKIDEGAARKSRL
jgi:hypothetical protein